jgi:alpha-mannosidase
MGGETSTSSRSTSAYPQLATVPVGKKIEGIYTDRLKQFTSGGQYQKESLLE